MLQKKALNGKLFPVVRKGCSGCILHVGRENGFWKKYLQVLHADTGMVLQEKFQCDIPMLYDLKTCLLCCVYTIKTIVIALSNIMIKSDGGPVHEPDAQLTAACILEQDVGVAVVVEISGGADFPDT